MENTLTIYNVSKDEFDKIKKNVSGLTDKEIFKSEQEQLPHIWGELGGECANFILSNPVQAAKNAVEIGIVLWGAIKGARAIGKKLYLGKELIKPLIFAKAKEEIGSEDTKIENPIIWGPMEIEPLSGIAFENLDDWDQTTSPIAYLTSISLKSENDRTKILWYIIGAGGNLYASWYTQHLSENIKQFWSPYIK